MDYPSDVIGMVVDPSQLIVPTKEGTYTGTRAGEFFLSGNKLWVNVDGTNVEVVTSA